MKTWVKVVCWHHLPSAWRKFETPTPEHTLQLLSAFGRETQPTKYDYNYHNGRKALGNHPFGNGWSPSYTNGDDWGGGANGIVLPTRHCDLPWALPPIAGLLGKAMLLPRPAPSGFRTKAMLSCTPFLKFVGLSVISMLYGYHWMILDITWMSLSYHCHIYSCGKAIYHQNVWFIIGYVQMG